MGPDDGEECIHPGIKVLLHCRLWGGKEEPPSGVRLPFKSKLAYPQCNIWFVVNLPRELMDVFRVPDYDVSEDKWASSSPPP